MTAVPVTPLKRFVQDNAAGMSDEGHYLYAGASSTTWTLPNSAEIGDDQDDQVYWVDHGGADASLLTCNIGGSDRLYDASITGGVVQTLNTNLLTGQTRTSIVLIKGDRLLLTKHARLQFWQILRLRDRLYTMLPADTAYTPKYYDNLVLMDCSVKSQALTLPPIDGFLINGEARSLEIMLAAQTGAFLATINAGTTVSAAAQNINGSASTTLIAAFQKIRLRPINSTTWGIFS